AAAGTAQRLVPRRAVAGADIKKIELGIVRHRVPDGAAAAELPPLAVPRLGGHRHRFVLEAVRGIAGHREETPDELAGLRVVRGDVTAHAVFGAAVADEHTALHDAGRPGDRIGQVAREERVDLPDGHAGRGIERDEAAVERADVDLAVPRRDAAIHDVAARAAAPLARHLRVVHPEPLAG